MNSEDENLKSSKRHKLDKWILIQEDWQTLEDRNMINDPKHEIVRRKWKECNDMKESGLVHALC